MSPQKLQTPITIIGAGLAGLTLARCLQRKGIQSIIYDNTKPTSRRQYAFDLHPAACQSLLQVLDVKNEVHFRSLLAFDGFLPSFEVVVGLLIVFVAYSVPFTKALLNYYR